LAIFEQDVLGFDVFVLDLLVSEVPECVSKAAKVSFEMLHLIRGYATITLKILLQVEIGHGIEKEREPFLIRVAALDSDEMVVTKPFESLQFYLISFHDTLVPLEVGSL
jgi:hypothetical protein